MCSVWHLLAEDSPNQTANSIQQGYIVWILSMLDGRLQMSVEAGVTWNVGTAVITADEKWCTESSMS